MRYLLLILLINVISVTVNATIGPPKNKKQKKKEKELVVKSGPQKESVFDRNLIEEEPVVKDILIENAAYYKDTSKRNFNSTILGYVTPVSFDECF